MTAINVKLGNIGSFWTSACKQAVHDLNLVFKKKGVAVTLAVNGAGPTISVQTDATIGALLVHGKTSAETDGSGKLVRADVRLPAKLSINSPNGVRDAGAGVAEVIAAHEFVHALGHAPHNSQLMTRTWTKVAGDRAAGDKLQAGSAAMPPLQLADESVDMLKGIWS